jgi:hypothetical protein
MRAEQPAPQSSPAAKRITTAPEAVTTVHIDLAEYVAMRGVTDSGGSGKKVITLAPARTRLKLRLPEGSLAGSYTLSLIDEFEQPLVTAPVISRDGEPLITTLDLRRISTKNCRLKLQRREEFPDYFEVTIAEINAVKKATKRR